MSALTPQTKQITRYSETMKTQAHNIILNLKGVNPQEFITEYREAVFEVLHLIFERRELDLKEEQLQAMSLLVRSAQKMKVNPNS